MTSVIFSFIMDRRYLSFFETVRAPGTCVAHFFSVKGKVLPSLFCRVRIRLFSQLKEQNDAEQFCAYKANRATVGAVLV